MERSHILSAHYLDIVFDGRNKAYGSYELRTHYHQRLKKAMAISLLLIVTFCAFVMIRQQPQTHFQQSERQTPIEFTEVTIPPRPEAPKTAAPTKNIDPPPAAKTFEAAPPKIVKDPLAVKPPDVPKDPDALLGARNNPTGTQGGHTDGKPDGKGKPGDDLPGGGGGGSSTFTNTPFKYAEIMPSFPGGMDRMRDWLQQNLRYPAQAREAGAEGRVFVKFVVNEDGSITEIEIVRGFGYGSEEEALRVIAAMPKWSPGMQNGRAVKVFFNLPLSFSLE